MAGHIGELGRGAQEAAALPLRMPRRAREVPEDRLDLCGQTALGLREPFSEQREVRLVARGEIGGDQVVLALEVVIQRALGEAGLGRDLVDADAADAFIVEQRARRLDDTLAGRLGGSRHTAYVY